MGALDMGVAEEELQPLVDSWRNSNPKIVKLWWDVDRAALAAVKQRTSVSYKNLVFTYSKGLLLITLPSGRRISYVKPQIAPNRFGKDAITYEGTGVAKKWERLETYGPKLVEI